MQDQLSFTAAHGAGKNAVGLDPILARQEV